MDLRARILAGLIALGVLLPVGARADTIQSVYLCGSTVEILLAPSQAWLFADTADGATTDKIVDRIYAMALATWLSGKSVTWFYPRTAVSSLPCIAGPTTAYRITVLQAQ